MELLEAKLMEWPGTLLLVSHDRAFLDHVVTSTIVFEGAGQLREYVGGYEDWQRHRQEAGLTSMSAAKETEQNAAPKPAPPPARQGDGARPAKLSYREQRELDELPARIERLEDERRTLDSAMASPDFYKEAADTIKAAVARREAIEDELTALYARWDALDSRVT